MAYNWETYYYRDPDWVSSVNKLRSQTVDTMDAMSNNILSAITSLKTPHSLTPYASPAMNQPIYQSLGTVNKYKITDNAALLSSPSYSVNSTTLDKFGKISNAHTHKIKLNEIDQDVSALRNGDTDYGNILKIWMEDAGYITNKQRAIKFSRDYFFINRPYLESDVSGPYRSFCFLTRPNLNLVTKDGDRYLPIQELSYYPELMALVASDLELYAELCRDGCYKSNLWTFASNYISNVASPTFGSTDVEGIKNGFGVEQKLPSMPDYHNVAININFMDNYRSDMAKLFKYDNKEQISLPNPMSYDKSVIRTSILPSLLNTYNYNKARKVNDVNIYEISKTYDKNYVEDTKVALLMKGNYISNVWQNNVIKVDFYLIKGIIENVLDYLGFKNRYTFTVDSIPSMHPGMSALILLDREPIGIIGRIHPEVEKDEIYVAEFSMTKLLSKNIKPIKYKEANRYPGISKDVAFVVDKNITNKEIEDVIKKSGGRLLNNIDVFDIYTGDKVLENEKSIAYNLKFEDSTRTLTEEEVMTIFNKIISDVESKLNAKVRNGE